MADKLNRELAVFQDPGYVKINRNVLSTSTVSSAALEMGGFGPVIPEGYGIGEFISLQCVCDLPNCQIPCPTRSLSLFWCYLGFSPVVSQLLNVKTTCLSPAAHPGYQLLIS